MISRRDATDIHQADTNLHCKTTDMETVDWLLGEVYCPIQHITAHVWGWTARILL